MLPLKIPMTIFKFVLTAHFNRIRLYVSYHVQCGDTLWTHVEPWETWAPSLLTSNLAFPLLSGCTFCYHYYKKILFNFMHVHVFMYET